MISPALVYPPTTEPVARALIRAGAYLIKPTTDPGQFFSWKSGIRAPVYTDVRVLNGFPGERAIVMRALGSSIRANFPTCDIVVGIAEAGIVWSTLAAIDLGIAHAFVRKTVKQHGTAGLVVGVPGHAKRAVIVDDLLASGGSVESAIETLREETRLSIDGIQTVVNWDFLKMRERFRLLGVPVRALVSFPQLLQAGLERGLLTSEAQRELSAFYRNPFAHSWDLSAFDSKSQGGVA